MSAPRSAHWRGSLYAQHSTPQLNWAAPFLNQAPFKGDEEVLDLGCGDGKISALLASKVPSGRVLGGDASESMLHTARESYPQSQHPNLSFQPLNAQEIDLQERFDFVTSFSCLQWVADQPAVLRGIRSVLKPGGGLYIHVPVKWYEMEYGPAVKRVTQSKPWSDYLQDFHPPYNSHNLEAYYGWLREAGFYPESLSIISKTDLFASLEDLCAWVQAWTPYLSRIPQELHPSYMTQLGEEYLKQIQATPDGQIPWRMFHLEVKAWLEG